MSARSHSEEEYYAREYGKLVGKTVEAVTLDTVTPEGPWYGLKFTDGTTAWPSRDQEMNGPGHLQIEPPNKNN